MGFEVIKEKYAGSIKEVVIGKGDKAVKVGGETCLPFYLFEGEMPNKPKIAMEVWDMEPPEWPDAAKEPFKDCLSDPAKWAKKCVEEYGAEIIALQLKSTDPNDKNASAEEAVQTVKKVLEAVDVPIIVWGSGNVDKDAEVLKKVAEECEGANLAIGPIEEKNHKAIGASVIGFNHVGIASSPIDVNLAKQINILLENLGLPLDRVLIDPTTGGLGYGLEYAYSVMERIRLAAMTFGDDKLQLPIVNNLGPEVWKCKEAKQTVDEAPLLGDPERRAILMECVAAICYLVAGSDILILRHPESVRLIRTFIDLLIDGGSATDIAGIEKRLPEVEVDYASLAPEPDLTIEEEKEKKPEVKKEAAPPKVEKKEEKPKEEKPKEEKAPPKVEKPVEAKKEEKVEEKAPPKEEEKPAVAPAAAAAVAIDEAKLASLIKEEVRKALKELGFEKKEEEKKMKEEEKVKAEEEKLKEEEEAKKKEQELIEKLKKEEEALKEKIKKIREEEKEVEVKFPEVPEKPLFRMMMMVDKMHRREKKAA